jgi:pimeloyl-ACP methyl ester carboxylesterase
MFIVKDFEIKGSGGLPIKGDITYANSYPDYLVIFVHGYKGFKDWGTHQLTANYFANKSIYFLKFNFSHSGVSPDDLSDINDLELFSKNTPSKELFDLDQVITFAANKFPHLQIVLLGHSKGGALSVLQAAKDKRVIKLITWAAIGSFRNLWKQEDEENWKKTGFNYVLNGRTGEKTPLSVDLLNDVLENENQFNISEAAKNIAQPWLIVQGTEDPAVKIEVAQNFNKQQPKSKLMIVEGANHVFGAFHPYLDEKLPADLEKVCLACADFVRF